MDSLKPVSISSLTDAEIEALGPWVVVTAIHNEDRHNEDVAWYAACESRFAHARLWARRWYGGHYAACIYPCRSRDDAERLREFLELRDLQAIQKRDAAMAAAVEIKPWKDRYDDESDDGEDVPARKVYSHAPGGRRNEATVDRSSAGRGER